MKTIDYIAIASTIYAIWLHCYFNKECQKNPHFAILFGYILALGYASSIIAILAAIYIHTL